MSMELADKNAAGIANFLGLVGRLLKSLSAVRFSSRTRSMRVCESLALGERRQLLVVEWESRKYLIGAGQCGFTVLDKSCPNEDAGTLTERGER